MGGWSILKRARQAFYGWRILAAGGITGAIGSGLTFYGFTVFFLPISQSLGLNRAATSLVFSLSRAEGSVEGPVVGYLIDRLGPRKVLFAAAVMMGVGYILLSKVDSFITFLVVYMGIISLGFNAGVIHVPIAAANSWFARRRGLATGIIMACSGLGGALIAPVLSSGIQHFGWRTTAFLSGLVILGILLPSSLVFRRSPESMGLLPDGDNNRAGVDTESAVTSAPVPVDFRVGEALRTVTFWVLTAATCLRLAAYTGVIIHFVPIMVWKGTSEPRAAVLLGTLALLSVPVRVLLGWAGDRLSRARIIAAGCGAGAVALLLLNHAEPGWEIWMVVVFLTIGESVGPLSWALIGDFFGRQHYATIRGAMTAFTGIAGAVVPVVAGMIFDTTQSYEMVLWITSALFALSAAVFAVLRPPRVKLPQDKAGTRTF